MGGCSLQHSFPPLLPSNAIARGSSSPPPSARLRPVSTPAYALQVTTHAIFPTSQPHFSPLHLVLAASYTHAFVLTFVCASCLGSVSSLAGFVCGGSIRLAPGGAAPSSTGHVTVQQLRDCETSIRAGGVFGASILVSLCFLRVLGF